MNEKTTPVCEQKPLVREITLEELQEKVNPNDPRSQLCCYWNYSNYTNTYYYNTQQYYNLGYRNVYYYNTHYHNYWNLA